MQIGNFTINISKEEAPFVFFFGMIILGTLEEIVRRTFKYLSSRKKGG